MSSDVDAAEAAARAVLRLLAVGDIEIVWLLSHVDYRTEIVDDFLGTASGLELLAAYGPRLHRAQFFNLARQGLLNALGPLPGGAKTATLVASSFLDAGPTGLTAGHVCS